MTCSRTLQTMSETVWFSSPVHFLQMVSLPFPPSLPAPPPASWGTLNLSLDRQPLRFLPAPLWTRKPQLTCPATGVEAAEWLGELGRDLQAARSCCCLRKVTTFWATGGGRGRGCE